MRTSTRGSTRANSVRKKVPLKDLKYWAIRIGEWIEFRVGSQPPKKLVSSLTRTVKESKRRGRYNSAGALIGYDTIPSERKETIRQVTWVGGKPLGVVRFSKASPLFVPPEGIVETDRITKNTILNRGVS